MRDFRLTIRARITGGSLLIAILISIAAGILIYNQVQRIVSAGQARVLESIEGQYVTAITDGDTQEMDPPGPGQLVAVVDPDGTVAINTLPTSLSTQVSGLALQPDDIRTIEAEDVEYLVGTTSVNAADGVWHVITASTQDDEVLNQVALLLITSITVINISFGAAAWFIGSAALSPVTRLRRSAADIVSKPGTELLPVDSAGDEISDLARTLNELITNLRASAERERQIVSDASHEFRTPLAIIQTRLELAQRQAKTLEEMQVDVSAAQKALGRLSALATSMLELSRIDAQNEPGRAAVADLERELGDAVDRGRQRVAARDIFIDFTSETTTRDQWVSVSDADFGRVCDNLISNALAALDKTGVIDLRIVQGADNLTLTVSDDAGGMDESYLPYALDRFSRQNVARTPGGAGLGLAIVAGIASTSGGTATLHNNPGIGLEVEVTFPLVADPR